MSKFQLILTSDYEIWGNGKGCVEKCIIEPAQKMMDIAEKHDAKITFFLDVCEYWAFEKTEALGLFTDSYKPASLIKEQLQNAIRNGHDVQLHFHPQWLNYIFKNNYDWELDYRYWKLPDVVNYHNDEWSLEKLFEKGVQTLNLLFKPIDSKYKVLAFRAGGWCIQPEETILKTIINSGIQVDSTVASGKKNLIEPYSYDFTAVPTLPYWEVGKKITQIGNKGLLELPICTGELSIIDKINFKFQKLKYKSKFLPFGCIRNSEKKEGKLRAIGKILREPWMLNFSDGATFMEMKKITELYMKKHASAQMNQGPIVAISHPKTFGIENEFERFISWINDQSDISIDTFTTWMNKMKHTQ